MAIQICKVCGNNFYARPSHIKKGWGVFCSRKCKHNGARNSVLINCFECGQLVYKTTSQMNRSKSGKLFCNKSCQTKWRNIEYSGKKHVGWKGGRTLYRKIMLKSSVPSQCAVCQKDDLRILVVHHIDQDHSNYNLENLVWLCHNCHYLVHHDKLAKQRFSSITKPS